MLEMGSPNPSLPVFDQQKSNAQVYKGQMSVFLLDFFLTQVSRTPVNSKEWGMGG